MEFTEEQKSVFIAINSDPVDEPDAGEDGGDEYDEYEYDDEEYYDDEEPF